MSRFINNAVVKFEPIRFRTHYGGLYETMARRSFSH
jgi:hypothetical protein